MKSFLAKYWKTILIVFLLLAFFFKDRIYLPFRQTNYLSSGRSEPASPGPLSSDLAYESKASLPVGGAIPKPEIEERMVVEESNLSLVVDNVRQKVDQVLDYTNQSGGYMISSSLSQPEEAPFATLVVRLPREKLRPALDFLRILSIKVTSENLIGQDVTDQYFDIEERLSTLYKTKAKFEEILNQASKIDDILRVQREIISLQSQIDSLKGQQEYLKKTAENARLTVYLSTDEWSLPYAPEEPGFRPKVIFKQAVRSLVRNIRALGKLSIWVLVYGLIWLPLLIVIKVIRNKRIKSRRSA